MTLSLPLHLLLHPMHHLAKERRRDADENESGRPLLSAEQRLNLVSEEVVGLLCQPHEVQWML